MSNSRIAEHAADIRYMLNTWGPRRDPAQVSRYSIIASTWEFLRYRRAKGLNSPAEDARYYRLTAKLRDLIAAMGFDHVNDTGGDAVAGVTQFSGHLPHDLSHLLGESWQRTAASWIDPPEFEK